MTRLKIYLAGKIQKNCWRHSIVAGLRDVFGGDGENHLRRWPILEQVVLGEHDYVGPYFVSCDHGCYHDTDHAQGIVAGDDDADAGCAQVVDALTREQIASTCLAAVDRADLVFAWLDGPGAFGTFAELIWARAKGIETAIAFSPSYSPDADTWFPRALIPAVFRPSDATEWSAKLALQGFLEQKKKGSGIVYFIEAVGLDRIKIGWTSSLESRLRQLSTGSPTKLNVLATIEGSKDVERELHRKFESARFNLEWFHATKDLRLYIQSVAKKK